jgi:hypothetical protein
VSWLIILVLWIQSLLSPPQGLQEAPAIPVVPGMPQCCIQPLQVGIGKYYSPGVMERVARHRGLPVRAHMASVPDCTRLGESVQAEVNGHLATYEVVDCSAPQDRARHLAEGLVLEVDYNSARAYFPPGEGRADVQILQWIVQK